MLRLKSRVIFLLGMLFLLSGIASNLSAQLPAWTDRSWIRIGSYQHFYEAWGWSYSWNGRFYEGMQWPALYTYSDNFVNKRPYIGVKNWTDVNGDTWDTYVWGSSSAKNPLVATPVVLKQTANFEMPKVYVDNIEITAPYRGAVNDVNVNQIPDRIVTNIVNTNLGITIKKRVLAFSQQYHDNYHILEYKFINSGNIDGDEEIELPDQTINDMYFGVTLHYATSREAAFTPLGNQQSWGIAQWISFRGETYKAYVKNQPGSVPEDSIRAVISWLGRRGSEYVSYDNIGAPDVLSNGRLVAPQFIGQALLYSNASMSNDDADDLNQPATMGWNNNDDHPNVLGPPSDSKIQEYSRSYSFLQGEMYNLGDTTDMWEANKGSVTYPEALAGGGGAAGFIAYGPYTIPFGYSVTIVRVEGASGLSREKCEEIGELWLQAYDNQAATYDFPMPDGSVITGSYNDGDIGENTADQFKDAWVMTGMDSLINTFGRARQNYESGYNIPQPPPPPQIFNVESGGDRIFLSWTDESESAPDFAGYRIYRAVGRSDTTYEEIFACGEGTDNPEIVHEFSDVSPHRGFSYYYYIVAFDDGTQNDGSMNPSGSLHSNPYYTRTTEPARLKRKPGESLSDIRIVPNPFNLAANKIQVPLEQDRILFLDVPGQCKIRIFSERGDLINTIMHTDGSGDEAWNSISSARQVVVSGVYLVHFEVLKDQIDSNTGEILYHKGDTIVKKLAIVR